MVALAQLQWDLGQQDAALASLDAAVLATPGDGRAHVALGNMLLQMGRPADAARHFRLAQRADGGLFEGLAHDFASALPQAEIHAPSPGYVLNAHFAIGGDERRALYAHPDSRVVYPVQVPHGAVLTFALGTSPDSWGQPGDGVEFAVIVADRERTEPVFARYIDPKRDADDRRWHDVAVDLDAYGGRTVRIVFQTTSGPAADSRFDWAVWGEPRLWAP